MKAHPSHDPWQLWAQMDSWAALHRTGVQGFIIKELDKFKLLYFYYSFLKMKLIHFFKLSLKILLFHCFVQLIDKL